MQWKDPELKVRPLTKADLGGVRRKEQTFFVLVQREMERRRSPLVSIARDLSVSSLRCTSVPLPGIRRSSPRRFGRFKNRPHLVPQSSAPNLQTVAEQPVIRQAVDISGNAVEVGADALPRGNGSGKSG